MKGFIHFRKIKISNRLVLAVLPLLLINSHGASAVDAIAEAAREGDLEQSRQLIAAGSDVNSAEPDGTTPLLWAVYNSNADLVDLLLEAGADPDIRNTLNISPVLQASRYGNASLLSALLDHGARIESSGTETPLMAAARSGSAEAVKLLLMAGANPNGSEPVDDQTALMWAVAEGHHGVAAILLEAGAEPDRKARVSELTQRKNADFPTGGFAALHWAARNGDDAMVELLAENGADMDIRNGDGSTPMMLAIVNDRFDTAARLVELGADANDGSLYYATVMRDATTDWRARDGTVFRADHHNSISALELTRVLLEAGADPNLPVEMQMHNATMCCDTKAGETAFYRSAMAADVDGMRLMVRYGADVDWRPWIEAADDEAEEGATGSYGKSALMVAINGAKGVGVAGGPNDLRYGPPDFREEGQREPFAAVELLLEAGADVTASDKDGNTALHAAVKALHPDIVKVLMASGASVDAANASEETPLQVAEGMEAPKPVPGFYFAPPLAQPEEISALLRASAGAR